MRTKLNFLSSIQPEHTPYHYSANDPINKKDPSGYLMEELGGAVYNIAITLVYGHEDCSPLQALKYAKLSFSFSLGFNNSVGSSPIGIGSAPSGKGGGDGAGPAWNGSMSQFTNISNFTLTHGGPSKQASPAQSYESLPQNQATNAQLGQAQSFKVWGYDGREAASSGSISYNNKDVQAIVATDFLSPESVQNQVNSFVKVWNNPTDRHYAPNVAQHLVNNQIAFCTVVYTPDHFDTRGGETYKNGRVILLNFNLFTGQMRMKNILNAESVVFHELVHTMGYGEYGAFAAQLAAGYITPNDILSSFEFSYVIEGMPDNLRQKHLDSNNNIITSKAEFFLDMYNYGKTITGQLK